MPGAALVVSQVVEEPGPFETDVALLYWRGEELILA
jgi:hypothetical protein